MAKVKIENVNAYRVQLTCKIARDVLDGVTPPPFGTSRVEYALYNIACAIEDLSKQVVELKNQ